MALQAEVRHRLEDAVAAAIGDAAADLGPATAVAAGSTGLDAESRDSGGASKNDGEKTHHVEEGVVSVDVGGTSGLRSRWKVEGNQLMRTTESGGAGLYMEKFSGPV